MVLLTDMAITGQQIGEALCRLLQLPKYTRSFTLRCAVDEVVTVKCEYYPDISVGKLESVFAEYELVLRAEPKPIDFDAWMADRKQAAHEKFMRSGKALSTMDMRLFCRG